MRASILFLTLLLCAGCASTVHQAPVAPKTAGFYAKPVKTDKDYIVPAEFRDRYNALVAIYGAKKLENGSPVFVPPLKADDGLAKDEQGRWHMSFEAAVNMGVMAAMKRRGDAP